MKAREAFLEKSESRTLPHRGSRRSPTETEKPSGSHLLAFFSSFRDRTVSSSPTDQGEDGGGGTIYDARAEKKKDERCTPHVAALVPIRRALGKDVELGERGGGGSNSMSSDFREFWGLKTGCNVGNATPGKCQTDGDQVS